MDTAPSPSPQASPPPPSNNSASPPPPPPASNPASPPPQSNSTSPAPASPPTVASPPPPSPANTTSPAPAASPSPSPPSSNSTTPPPPPSTPSTTSSPPPPPSSTPTTKSSPPPPPSSGSSSSTPASPSPTTSSSPPSSGTSTGLVVGVAIGGVALLVVVIVLFLCCRKKKRRGYEEGAFYAPPPPPPKVDPRGGRQQHWQQSLPTIPDNHVAAAKPSPNTDYTPSQTNNFSSSGGSQSNMGSENTQFSPSPGLSLGFSKNTFSLEELSIATDGFSDANLLGQGGFGYVHKGVLPNGKEIAVKQLKAGSGQGEREFQAEVEIISRVHHKHLVSLVGYCITGSQRLLVYEFLPNNTLEFHLHGKGRPTMDWPTRLKIALGAAKGIAYLHEDCHPKIIHRDIKASNILLDYKFEAKVSDFGLAKISSDVNTHVSTRVMGTFGYLAPEYASSGKLTDKSDVFSYGVMLLELITGRRPLDTSNTFMEDSLVDWARPLLVRALDDGNYETLVDPKLEKSFDQSEMARVVACAAACVRHSAKRRPKMSLVVRALEGEMSLGDLNEGIRPGHSRVYGSYGSSDYDSGQYREDMKVFRKLAMGSQEYGGSSEMSEPTSQYGLYPSASSGESQQR